MVLCTDSNIDYWLSLTASRDTLVIRQNLEIDDRPKWLMTQILHDTRDVCHWVRVITATLLVRKDVMVQHKCNEDWGKYLQNKLMVRWLMVVIGGFVPVKMWGASKTRKFLTALGGWASGYNNKHTERQMSARSTVNPWLRKCWWWHSVGEIGYWLLPAVLEFSLEGAEKWVANDCVPQNVETAVGGCWLALFWWNLSFNT